MTERTGPPPDVGASLLPPQPDRRASLSGQQRTLLGALERLSPLLGRIYFGGLAVLNDLENPDRYALCAHSMRELMEKLPEHLDVATPAQKVTLKGQVIELARAFSNARNKTACLSTETGWSGPIDGNLGKFLAKLEKFFAWFERHFPSMRDEFGGVLRRLDGSDRALPPALASLNVDAWAKKRDYFQAVAHHRKDGMKPEFDGWLDALERFLLDRLVPRTFDDFDTIDTILQKGGS